jgi:hypothetical protein
MNPIRTRHIPLFIAWAVSLSVTGLCLAADPVPPRLQSFGILPASVLKNESTEIPSIRGSSFSAKGWAGLVCGPSRCQLRPIRLETKTQDGDKVSIVYPTAGRRPVVKGEYTIALLRGFSNFVKADVPTWFTLRTPRNPADAVNGSLGISILIPGQSSWRMVPRWAPAGSNDFLTFYLEAGESGHPQRRQALGRVKLETVNGGIKPKDVLIWAGDLDGDGKVDLITRGGPNSSQPGLKLWLSGQAQAQELVGPAAELTDWSDVEEALGC